MSVSVMGLVWWSTVEGPSRRHVLLAMADRADDEGICWPGYDNLRRKTGISRRQVIRIVNELEAEGWIVRDNTRKTTFGDQDTNLYQIDVPKLRASQQDDKPDEDEARAEKLARLAEAKTRRFGGGSDTKTPPPADQGESDSGGSDTTTPPPTEMSPGWCQDGTTPGDTTAPNTSLKPPENRGEGETCQPDGRADEPALDPTAPHPPEPPQKASLEDPPRLWMCAEHRAARVADPEADIPGCYRCRAVREHLTEKAATATADVDSRVAAADACGMCAPRSDGDPDPDQRPRLDFAGAVLSPWTACDHVTPLPTVLAELGAAAAEEADRDVPAVQESTPSAARAAALAMVRSACRSTGPRPERGRRRIRTREYVADGVVTCDDDVSVAHSV